ncbi:hypothetical protein CAOG_03956 [Capsaspora owczarzaki ATCC 30864]|uniref:Centromere protein M n=1 Tax=Capsaspora owczarzaki (strain ATCC 30864) TaxID=595528 RepID=A0A0D2X2T6_CAPO3|nr:hypothetical protein CAOG_03956 [Capsaspora owczarzaki ATCC 30864]KJE93124.1 hypothetical protein CAOG_003956 [Capsaspora owczarzaki ATCC 30864]|eukprot:XP_004363684.2 hypothetical protein CAOG_03956 [Capsaspora owczarzaki ATCC 30864]
MTLLLYDKLPTQNLQQHATILLVGTHGVGKSTLAHALLAEQERANLAIQIRKVVALPLPTSGSASTRPKIDFVVFMLDMTSKLSLDLLKSAIQQVDIEYLIGKSCIVATHVDMLHLASIEVDEIDQLLLTYELPFLQINQLNEQQRAGIAQRILRQARVAVGRANHMTPAIVAAMERALVTSTLINDDS